MRHMTDLQYKFYRHRHDYNNGIGYLELMS